MIQNYREYYVTTPISISWKLTYPYRHLGQCKHFATPQNRSILGKYRNVASSKIRNSFLVYFVELHRDHKASP